MNQMKTNQKDLTPNTREAVKMILEVAKEVNVALEKENGDNGEEDEEM
jgi:hypothetical protein